MKTMMKRIAMLTLSACMLVGGAVSSFAATGASSHYTVSILGHQTNDCEGTANGEIVARFSSPYGDVQDYVICGECGDVNGKSCLSEVDDATANFSELCVYQGKLDNGERIMTVACLSSGVNAMSGVTANVMMPWDAIEGYDLYLVNADGTESAQTEKTRRFAALLAAQTQLPVVFEDERCSTAEAEGVLIAGGVRREKRKESIDSIAASYILEGYLNKIKKERTMSEEKKLHEADCDCGCEEEETNLVELIDEEGKAHKCYHIGTIEYKDGWYAFFQSAEEGEEDTDEVTILQIVGEEGNEELVPVEDEKLLDEVFDEFCRVMEEDDDADEAASLDTDYEEGCGCGCKNHDHKK